jgi:ribosomal protein S18 acetylase RimI-like enzyme
MLIRPGEPKDIPDIAACAEAAFGKYVERIGRRPAPMDADFKGQIAAGNLFVLESEGVVAGYVTIHPIAKALHLDAIALLPQFQGQGHGKALMTFVEQQAQRLGKPAIELYTNVKMVENLELYPRFGFVETGRRIQYGYARVFFRKEISPA